jgi:hypothetical protein
MELNNAELENLPPADNLCLVAYAKCLESIKEYQEKIDSLDDPKDFSFKVLSLVKETHESYSTILLNILAELPTIQDSMIIKESAIQSKAKKIRKKIKSS